MSPVRIARIISRLNVGGPAIQAITLTKLLEARGYETLLVRGAEASHEGSMDDLAERYGVQPKLISGMRRELSPGDVAALPELVATLRRFRPQLVHTHAAKAGALGRAATLLAWPLRPPPMIHTYHGHSLEGYFSPRKARLFLAIEKTLGRRSSRLVAVSDEVRDDLVRMGVAPSERFEVVPLGFDLSSFDVAREEREIRATAVREGLGVPSGVRLVTLVARLVPIKRVDRFLEVATLLMDREDVHFAIVGDGELRAKLHKSVPEALRARFTWTGFRRDIPDVCFASDVVVLTSDNEGTPVSLIEAQAAEVPVVSTRVGGAATVVLDGQTGHLVPRDDPAAFAEAVRGLLDDPVRAHSLGREGRRHVLTTFALPRLVEDVDHLYRRILADDDAGLRTR
jgi:glycosyltransferase involved in cell wall biosynthesis